jgi:hypothetical protein
MEKTRRKAVIIGAVACFELFGTTVPARAQEARTFSLQVLVVNQAAPPDALIAAETTACRIYSALGIDFVWVRASEDRRPGDYVTIVVTPRAIPGSERHALGTAVANRSSAGRRAYVYLDRVSAFAESTDSALSSVLAHVIAHEIGHLLIGHNGHALTGLMSSQWNRIEIERLKRGGLTFTDDHARAIRARLAELNP